MRRALVPLAVFAALSACAEDAPSGPTGACPDVELIVAASDYSSAVACGAPGCFEEEGVTTARELGADPALVRSNDRTFFIARYDDTIFDVDRSCGTVKRTGALDLGTFKPIGPTGKVIPANPHDVAVADDGAIWVPLYNTPKLAIVTDGVVGPSIDLASYDEVDGNPQAESIRIVGGKAFVALEVLDDGADVSRGEPISTRPSKMLRIDVATRQVEAVIELAGRNPFNPMQPLGTALFLAEPNNADVADEPFGGIERFETTNSTTKLLVREADLGGSVMEVAVTAGCGAAIVAGPVPTVNPTALVTFDPETGAVLSTFQAPVFGPTAGFDLQALAWRGDHLYVGDRRARGNRYPVHEFARTGTCTLQATGRTIDLPQPPVGLQAANQ